MRNLTSLIEPISISTISKHTVPSQMGYGRVDNPTRLALERKLARLEKARFALSFASGSAALAAVFSMLKKEDVVLTHNQTYEGTIRMLHDVFRRFGIISTSVDFSNEKELLQGAQKAQMMICESITNPCLQSLNIKKIGKVKVKKTLFVVDNTISTPIFSRPLETGADIVVHSLTKYIAGHHDVIAGAVMMNDPKLFKLLRHIQWTLGAIPSPLDCALILRGIQTLKIRMIAHQKNAQIVVRFLIHHKEVEKVTFPGVSGIVSFWIRGDEKKTVGFLKKLKHVHIAHSFGGTQTTILHPFSMMTWSISEKELKKQRITGNLVRMSVGIEDVDLIINDLRQALMK